MAVGLAADEEEVLEPVEEPVADGEPFVAVALLDAEVDELEPTPVFATTTPPATVAGLVLFPALAAAAAKAAKVLFDLGSLMTPTIPDWQCRAWAQ